MATKRGRTGSVPKNEVKISAVCTNCRERHLKCDGGPLCSRCRNEGNQCIFRPSRRGMRPTSRRLSAPDRGSGASTANAQWTIVQPATYMALDHASTPYSKTHTWGSNVTPDNCSTAAYRLLPQWRTPDATASYLVDLYYTHFHPSHPFLLARHQLSSTLGPGPHPLRSAVEYIGMFYEPSETLDRKGFALSLDESLSRRDQYPMSEAIVQALLLYSVGLRWDNQHTKAANCLHQARGAAYSIKWGSHLFRETSEASAQAESWKRTWKTLQEFCQEWPLDSALPAVSGPYEAGLVEGYVYPRSPAVSEAPSTSNQSIEYSWKAFDGISPLSETEVLPRSTVEALH